MFASKKEAGNLLGGPGKREALEQSSRDPEPSPGQGLAASHRCE